jgi:hypothetical protein
MDAYRKLTTKEAALTATFTALYAVFGFLKISPIIGLTGQAITAAAIIAPITGILLGPYLGTLSTFLGGLVGFFLGALAYPSFAAGIAAAFCAGMVKEGKRIISTLAYLALLLSFVFFPTVGPAWLFPQEMWFQIVGLIILVSPLQYVATKFLDSDNNPKLFLGSFLTCLPSTLAGQIAGSLVFELLTADPTTLLGYWQALTILYPVERTIIALAATLISVPLLKVLKKGNLWFLVHHPRQDAL